MKDPTAADSQRDTDPRSAARIVMNAIELNDFMAEAFGRPLEWEIGRVDLEGVAVRLGVDTSQLRPGGTVSGPTLMSLADGVAFLVVLSRIGPEALAVTSNLNINFLRRPKHGDIIGEGRLLKLGRSLALSEVALYSLEPDSQGSVSEAPDESTTGESSPQYRIDRNKPVAHATVTYSLALLDKDPR